MNLFRSLKVYEREMYIWFVVFLACRSHSHSLTMVGPPADVNWKGPWHEILHEWRIRIEQKLDCNVFFFFFSAPFCRRISVLDCCTGQSPGKGNKMTVVLVSLQATK